MFKKGCIISGIIAGALFSVVMLSGCTEQQNIECTVDSDCVASSCCHADACVPLSEKPKCDGVMCTMNCEPGTMDCGQGSCGCINNKCKAVIA